MKVGDTIKTSELQLADQVRMSNMADDTAKGAYLVRNIDKEYAYLWRPYIHHSEFSYTGGVIPYVGIEDSKIELTSSVTWLLVARTTLK